MASRPASTICYLTRFTLLLLALLVNFLQAQEQGRGALRSGLPVRRVACRQSAALPAAVTAEAYEPFQLCDGCRCCAASNANNCVDTSCCYAINCNIPVKHFGVCAFTPTPPDLYPHHLVDSEFARVGEDQAKRDKKGRGTEGEGGSSPATTRNAVLPPSGAGRGDDYGERGGSAAAIGFEARSQEESGSIHPVHGLYRAYEVRDWITT